MDNESKRMIILDNYQNPFNMEEPNIKDNYDIVNSNNQSCIDNINLYIELDNNIIKDIKFMGEACVIAISSTSILIRNLIGKTKEEAINIINNYHKMIEEEDYDKELIKDLIVYNDIYKQPSRKTCATLASRRLNVYFNEK